MFADASAVQVLDANERSDYRTGEDLERLAGEDTVVVLNDDAPSRLDQWLPWRDTRPMAEWAPVVVMRSDRAPDPGERVDWELCQTPVEGVFVREFRGGND
ncbi:MULTISPECIES: hypothetical protein [unclassified Haloarcula]|uniref:hypothetical protein n=1 Tax=unclassified Haloarcula TaxID=2624677 RepID=UPI000EF266D1|nr:MULTISPECIES: hypothetical protein [unclassified Haloarcula]RLM33508.1 hypothetical protein DVK01_17780 [Haloarcula sp. Atlit-120R]RLM42091.1 hypothetical protein DVK00_16955 [Haloarcula sp. Atlit-47R]